MIKCLNFKIGVSFTMKDDSSCVLFPQYHDPNRIPSFGENRFWLPQCVMLNLEKVLFEMMLGLPKYDRRSLQKNQDPVLVSTTTNSMVIFQMKSLYVPLLKTLVWVVRKSWSRTCFLFVSKSLISEIDDQS